MYSLTGTIKLSGLHFRNGGTSSGSGGALFIENSALVSLEGCQFSANEAKNGAGIYIHFSTVDLYSTAFVGNLASTYADDIFATGTTLTVPVTVHSTCPPDWSGTPVAGTNLDTSGSDGTI